jgi:hypothetical protein
MCSRAEFVERIQGHEISVFERNDTDGSPDPRRAVTKYRRSAAGSTMGTTRSLPQLRTTVQYLVRLLAEHYDDDDDDDEVDDDGRRAHQAHVRPSFGAAVQFFEDRIRAVQVDLTRSSGSSSRRVTTTITNHAGQQNKNDPKVMMQVMMARTQILILYLMTAMQEEEQQQLLSVAPSSSSSSCRKGDRLQHHHYERKFGVTALQTALSGYFDAMAHNNNENDDETWWWTTDQMMACSVLSAVNEMLRSSAVVVAASGADNDPTESFGHVWMEVTRLVRRQNHAYHDRRRRPGSVVLGPRTRWAVAFLGRVARGEWWTALAHLQHGPGVASSSDHRATDHTAHTNTVEQCCIDDVSKRYLQWRTIQTFNTVLSKGQTIKLTEVARLLFLVVDDNPIIVQTDPCDRDDDGRGNESCGGGGGSGDGTDKDSTAAMVQRQQQQQQQQQHAIRFSVQRFGLPMSDAGDGVIFKVAAISPPSLSKPSPPKSRQSTDEESSAADDGNYYPSRRPKLPLLQLITDGLAPFEPP